MSVRPPVYELRPFFAITAFSISRSRLRSATKRLSRPFLIFQRSQLLRFAGFHAAQLRLPSVDRVLGHAALPGHIFRRTSGLYLPRRSDDLRSLCLPLLISILPSNPKSYLCMCGLGEQVTGTRYSCPDDEEDQGCNAQRGDWKNDSKSFAGGCDWRFWSRNEIPRSSVRRVRATSPAWQSNWVSTRFARVPHFAPSSTPLVNGTTREAYPEFLP
jgi:hypothetical protein